MFRDAEYEVSHWQLRPGETLLLYTDGLAEAEDTARRAYGDEQLATTARRLSTLEPSAMVRAFVEDWPRSIWVETAGRPDRCSGPQAVTDGSVYLNG